MSIRLRRIEGHLVAICAAASTPQTGDIYLDDEQHYALAQKFWRDYRSFTGLPVDLEDERRAGQAEKVIGDV